MNAFGECFLVVGTGPDGLAFFAHDDGGACVLAAREDSVGGDLGVLEKHEGDHAIVLAGFGIIENGRDLLEVGSAEFEGDGLDRFVGKERESLGIDLEDFLAFEFGGGDEVRGDLLVFRGIGSEGKGVLVVERSHGRNGLEGAAFVDFDVVHEGLDVIAIGRRSFLFSLFEFCADVVAKATFGDVGSEPGEFKVGSGHAIFTGPGEGVFVGCSGENLCFEVVVIDAEELAGPEVHAEAQVALKVRMKSPGVHQAGFVEQAWKVDDAAKFEAGGTREFGILRHGQVMP